jgi:hypothetical protein
MCDTQPQLKVICAFVVVRYLGVADTSSGQVVICS